MNDRELVERARAGDHDAFEQLVQQYERKVYITAHRLMGIDADAMDASQEVFIRVYRFLDTFNAESSFSTWLYRITINVCKDMLPLELEDEENGTFVNEISDSTYDPVEIYERAELRQVIRTGIDALPETYKQIILLRDIAGLSYEEIADTLQIEIGTVKSRLSRARERLRNYLLQSGNKPISFRSKG